MASNTENCINAAETDESFGFFCCIKKKNNNLKYIAVKANEYNFSVLR